MSYKKQELLTRREHMGSLPVFLKGFHAAYFISFLFSLFSSFVLYAQCCPFLISLQLSLNVYCIVKDMPVLHVSNIILFFNSFIAFVDITL